MIGDDVQQEMPSERMSDHGGGRPAQSVEEVHNVLRLGHEVIRPSRRRGIKAPLLVSGDRVSVEEFSL